MTTNKKNELVFRKDRVLSECPPLPTNMMVELTNICNHKCIFCSYQHMKRKKRVADKEFTFKIIKDAFNNGVKEIGFYLIGEPFCNKDLPEFISYCKEIGFSYIYLTTNGALATPEKMLKVIDAGLDSVKFSINAATEDSYKYIHGENDFSTVKSNLLWLREYLDNSNKQLKTFISFVKNNFNKDEISLLYSEFEKLVDRIYVFECQNQGGNMSHLVESGVIDTLRPGASAPCNMVFNRLHITVEGFLDACCVDADGDLVVADLHKTSLLDAWNSDVFKKLRRQHLSGNFENILCKNCIENSDTFVMPLHKGKGDTGV